MRFLADECFDARIVTTLIEHGHDVASVRTMMPGADDATVLAHAFKDRRIVLTEDHDFGELVVRLQRPTRGVILLWLAQATHLEKARRLLKVVERQEDLEGTFTVVDPEKTRFRPLKMT
ncbi:MAG: hypothetical protein GVY18_16425 [Bacteroidetes bacterium]|jgi:predicted nuclease of predicted toxin-antitoxin system|nr:hypothetical protein [Bacteroidota bacterium]